ncbi:MAG: hypothetical protein ACK5CH_15635 [Bacteroidota bacterium]
MAKYIYDYPALRDIRDLVEKGILKAGRPQYRLFTGFSLLNLTDCRCCHFPDRQCNFFSFYPTHMNNCPPVDSYFFDVCQ